MSGKTFRDYYANEEFKQRHLARMKEKIDCECGKSVSRSNLSAHKKTKKHLRNIQIKTDDTDELENRIINKLINQFKIELKST